MSSAKYFFAVLILIIGFQNTHELFAAQLKLPCARALTLDELKKTSVNPSEYKLVANNRFRTWRSLQQYKYDFGQQFIEAIGQLNSNDLWLDAGAGLARPQVEFLQSSEYRAQKLIAVSLSYPKFRADMAQGFDLNAFRKDFKYAIESDRLVYVESDFNDFSLRPELQGQVKILTSNHGPETYSYITDFLYSCGRLVQPGGLVFIRSPEIEIVRPQSYLGYDEKRLNTTNVLKKIKGFDVHVSKKNKLIVFRRNHDSVYVPQLLSRGVDFDTWGYERLTLEWINTKNDWLRSHYNPQYSLYRGWPLPLRFQVPEK